MSQQQQQKKPVHYVDNKAFHNALVEYKDALAKAKAEGKPLPRIPEFIGSCIKKISEKLATSPKFVRYSFREEMILDGIENCLLYLHDYDPDYVSPKNPNFKQNAFAYFTQIVYYAFVRRINKEERVRYTLYKNFQETIQEPHLLLDSDDRHIVQDGLYDNINQFMKKFEEKEAEKKAKRKAQKEGLTFFLSEEGK